MTARNQLWWKKTREIQTRNFYDSEKTAVVEKT
jgi:hypothetical protein